MKNRFAMHVLLALAIALPALPLTSPSAHAETLFQILLRGRDPGVRAEPRNPARRNYRSDKSPVRRQVVRFNEGLASGVIVIDTSDRRLYYTLGNGKALSYGIGVGRDGFTWTGTKRISRKAQWPGWTPPKRMIERVRREEGRILPAYMPGGPNNPLGARAMYLGNSLFRIHGTNQPWTIGQAMSSGCIRMANDDVVHLYNQVDIGTKVIVRR